MYRADSCAVEPEHGGLTDFGAVSILGTMTHWSVWVAGSENTLYRM